MPSNYRIYLDRISKLRSLRGKYGRRLVGAVGLLWEDLAHGFRDAVRGLWVGDEVGPAYDGLHPAGAELSLPRYPNETWTQYHQRLQRAWLDWPFAGDEDVLVAQLAAAGWPGAIIYFQATGYWSEFWVFYPAGTHPVTAGAPPVGGFTVGDGTVIGLLGITPAELHTLRAIVRKFKPAHWICRAIIFEISGWTVGHGQTVGDVGLTIGGESVSVGAI